MTRERFRQLADTPADYRIVVAGHLGPDWSPYFDGLSVTQERLYGGAAVTVLHGTIDDQAALYSILARIQNVGLPLLSLTRDEMAF
ncbi:MAG: hypothetical protein GVY12_10030 [Bacteroidetes bacterium]|jgi:hypothetical protein|nr:hypothetical protein [Bacteroidota bacterium]